MLRNQLAKHLGLDLETLRFYEKENLISRPKRKDNGYREYSEKHLVELKFIRHCRSLGIGLKETKTLKDIQDQSVDCSQAKEIIDRNINLIEIKMKELRSLREQLISLSKSCQTKREAKDCEIVKSLNSAANGNSCACHSIKVKGRKKSSPV